MKSLFLLGTVALIGLVQANSYNPDIGLKTFYYSSAAYCDKNTISSWTCGEPCHANPGLIKITQINNEIKGTFGYTAYNTARNEIVIAFRGSANIQNWVTNLDFFQKAYPGVTGGMVHKGFSEAFDAVAPLVISSVKTLLQDFPSAQIVVTGHSLGAALATFAAIEIKNQINPPAEKITFYTFGSPRTGNQPFTTYVHSLFPNSGYQRVTHYNDIVPTQPPAVFGFNHAGDEVWYSSPDFNNLTYQVCPNTGTPESKSCIDSLGLSVGISAHLNYLGHQFTGICAKPQTPQNINNPVNNNFLTE